MDFCNDLDLLKTIYLIKTILNILKIFVPIVLIIMCTFDVYKMILNTSDKSYKFVFKRLFISVLVFFIPTILNIILVSLGENNFNATPCWVNANEGTINYLQTIRDKELSLLAEQEKEQKDAKEKELKQLHELHQQRMKEREAILNHLGNDSNDFIETGVDVQSGSFYENGVDGRVDVVNGVFYRPNSTTDSGKPDTKGSAPYGYNKYFFARLTAFIDAAAANGYTIVYDKGDGAWRSYERQLYFWNCYQTKACNNGNLAAQPGSSNHGWGIASDLVFGSDAAKYWAHDNCHSFGLAFPLCQNVRGNCTENWHIEPEHVVKR